MRALIGKLVALWGSAFAWALLWLVVVKPSALAQWCAPSAPWIWGAIWLSFVTYFLINGRRP